MLVLRKQPLLASRINAMMLLLFMALNAIVPVYEQYAYHHEGKCDLANPFAAAISAAHTVLKASWPDSASMLDAKLDASLSKIPDGPGKTQGIALGIGSGKAILALRAGDGAFQNPIADVPVSSVPGVYNAVPPFDYMLAPFWKSMQTFSLQKHDQFRSSPRPARTAISIRGIHEVKRMGEINSTLEQRPGVLMRNGGMNSLISAGTGSGC
jgi:hypothetical protein